MRFFLNSFALLVFISIVTANVAAQTAVRSFQGQASMEKRWETFSPDGGGFSVLMPGKITSQEQMVETPGGKRPNRIFYADFNGDVFMVTFMQFPESVTDPATIKLMLDNGRDRGVEASKAKLESENEITLDGYSGREWLLFLPNNIKAHAKAFWVSNMFYQVLVVTDQQQTVEAAKATKDRMTKFFNSFTLTRTASH